ncbi:protease [Alkalihalobacillus trypoxylicola]|uniref:Protease n=1 Tax=Alkalihalobacillus trypoxylicola TaxID=519424 RepID=A0A162EDH0_9BACI|nr:protease [Alkalihalobacillus trypoxylicola]
MTQVKSFHLNEIISLSQKIKMNPLFWLVLGIGILTGYFKEVCMVFMIVFIHEMGHGIMATFFKWNVKKIELLPFGGVAEVEDGGNKPFKEEFLIVLAGPVQHIWMIALSYLLVTMDIWSYSIHETFVQHNVMILLFNLLPILPLDGGKLLQLFCCYKKPYREGLSLTRKISFLSLITFFIFIVTFYPFHLNVWIVILFLSINNYLEWKQKHFRFIRFLMTRMNVYQNSYPIKDLYLNDTMSLKEAMSSFERGVVHQCIISNQLNKKKVLLHERILLYEAFENNNWQMSLREFSGNHRLPPIQS